MVEIMKMYASIHFHDFNHLALLIAQKKPWLPLDSHGFEFTFIEARMPCLIMRLVHNIPGDNFLILQLCSYIVHSDLGHDIVSFLSYLI